MNLILKYFMQNAMAVVEYHITEVVLDVVLMVNIILKALALIRF
ncbi:hypothetical protein O166_13555 [Pseudogulbenkiania ferrooxidans EGD-HP2]|uniref:Uncharacterized protein n=1 Tax=Pseudogulbenkiania ferrooxidans EGD-HP2 TaxID=1388764 RepID=A0ABP2XI57_9NEIS|nr:hypothetical protein O166_13555 [Pseudogulbenkiania ferrooxidans EGD-HP2]